MTAGASLARRIESVRARLPHGAAWWITRRQHVRYLTGVLPLAEYPAALLITADAAAALWPGEVPDAVPEWFEHRCYEPWPAAGADDPAGLAEMSRELVADHGSVGLQALVDADAVPLALADVVTAVPGADRFAAVTRSKDADEVESIRRNLAGNDAAFARIARELRAGATDFEIASWALAELAVHAGEVVAYDGNIGLGPGGADFEAQPTGRVAEAGDLLFVDLYPIRDGYGGDSTRSFAVGAPDAWAASAHDRLVRALDEAERRIEPGLAASELDRLCREIVGVEYPHHTGHGLGLFGQERPYVVPGSGDVLCEGDIVAVEPGAYRAGRGGMRIEDVFLVTADGCERLNSAPRVLEVC